MTVIWGPSTITVDPGIGLNRVKKYHMYIQHVGLHKPGCSRLAPRSRSRSRGASRTLLFELSGLHMQSTEPSKQLDELNQQLLSRRPEHSSTTNSRAALLSVRITMKGPTPEQHDGSGLRIGIVHARWNAEIIDPLLEGTKAKLLACGVQESNIVVESVPGSWELPIGVQR